MLGLPQVEWELKKDPEIKELWPVVENSTPVEAGDWPRHLRDYFVKDAEYSVAGNSVLMVDKVVILKTLRAEVALHHCHSGGRGIQARVREALFWPGLARTSSGHSTSARGVA